jgi:hypothetical protein
MPELLKSLPALSIILPAEYIMDNNPMEMQEIYRNGPSAAANIKIQIW